MGAFSLIGTRTGAGFGCPNVGRDLTFDRIRTGHQLESGFPGGLGVVTQADQPLSDVGLDILGGEEARTDLRGDPVGIHFDVLDTGGAQDGFGQDGSEGADLIGLHVPPLVAYLEKYSGGLADLEVEIDLQLTQPVALDAELHVNSLFILPSVRFLGLDDVNTTICIAKSQ